MMISPKDRQTNKKAVKGDWECQGQGDHNLKQVLTHTHQHGKVKTHR